MNQQKAKPELVLSEIGLSSWLWPGGTTIKRRNEMSSVGEDFSKEKARVRELLNVYRSIPQGAFGAVMLEDVLRRADQAVMSEDPLAILRSYEEMKGCE